MFRGQVTNEALVVGWHYDLFDTGSAPGEARDHNCFFDNVVTLVIKHVDTCLRFQ